MGNKIGKYAKSILFYTFIGLLLLYIVLQLFAPEMTVRVFRFKPYIVVTDSMEPEINVNDVVIVKNFKVDDLEVEDIITFYADVNYDGDKEIVTHYIYSITGSGEDAIIRTHRYYANVADATPDPWVLGGDDVLGLYSYHIPWVGSIGLFLKSPFGIGAMLVNVGIVVAIVVLIKKGNKEVPEKTE